MMRKFALVLTATAALGLAPLMAHASSDAEMDAATRDRVTAEMTAQGYEVRKIQMEDGMIEVYAVKDGQTYELYLDKDLKVVKTGGND